MIYDMANFSFFGVGQTTPTHCNGSAPSDSRHPSLHVEWSQETGSAILEGL